MTKNELNQFRGFLALRVAELEPLIRHAALGRIEQGNFGRCQECDQHIHLKRLTVVPWVTYCVRQAAAFSITPPEALGGEITCRSSHF
jgi:RNA polymerase-binding transcription factor DksA